MTQNAQTLNRSYSTHLRSVMTLGLPLVGSQVAQFALHMTDTIMVGWYGLEELAALILASGYWFILFIFMAGAAFALMPIVAKAEGQGDRTTIRRATRMAIWVSVFASVLFYPVFLWSDDILVLLGQEAEIAALAKPYMLLIGIETLPALIIAVMRSYFSALERTGVVLLITLAAVVINIPLNWLFIYGNLGLPEMGVLGAGLSSMIVSWSAVIALMTYAQYATPENELLRNVFKPDWEMFRKLIRMGVPIGLTSVAEVGLFNAATIMMGWISTVALAAHGIVLQISAVTFMVQVGISQAGTIRAGNAFGRDDMDDLKRGARVVVVLSAAVAAMTTLLFVIVPEPLIGLFMSPHEPARADVLALGAGLMLFAGLMQLSDGGQQVALGLLRGLHDTNVPMWIASFSYWVVGMAACYLLAFPLGMGATGIWAGFILGLSCSWVLMSWRFWKKKTRS